MASQKWRQAAARPKTTAQKPMKFTFKNIGPVKKAELELGNLTIIAGRNNTGKSYIAYTLYAFLAWFRTHAFFAGIAKLFMTESAQKEAGSISFEATEKDGKVLVLQKDAEQFFNNVIADFARGFPVFLHLVYAAAEKDFSGAGFSCEGLERFPTHSKGYKPYLQDKIASFSFKNGRFEVATKNEIPVQNNKIIAAQEILLFYMSQITTLPPYILPAERMSIPIFYKELDLSKSRFVETLQKFSENNPFGGDLRQTFGFILDSTARYGQPIRDNIDITRDIEHIQKSKGEFADSKLIDDVKSIVGGSYQYAKNQILFIPKPNGAGKKAIPLHSASSSAQCFALLYFYLRHIAQKGQLLIIDEPEAHLDTANQIKLARLLARCVNAGLKVLITTHSDYLVKEFNNLIMLSSKFEGKAKLLKKFKYSEDDSLKQENVKAYICENGGLASCKIDHQGMDMPIFDDAINSISDVSDELAFHLPESV